ncbi:hypothetical protein GCM10011383_43700 [Hymenobacter cavernae]|uniref:GAF domain-containing protein n=1 Tax=Hymenobacter cavernae TaxID=2044852 RepID=A0ABQ1UWX6_9BACT|nr:hypothetical protein GCM10011383_43700 [Hymenobacter cavernae]
MYGRDTIRYAVGNHVWTVTEEEPLVAVIAPGQENYYALGPTMHIARTDYYDLDEYRKQNVFFRRRHQQRYKLSRPRVTGNGLTGIYIDSIGANLYGMVSFHMYGRDLSATQEAKLLKLFDSITFTAIQNSCNTAMVDAVRSGK